MSGFLWGWFTTEHTWHIDTEITITYSCCKDKFGLISVSFCINTGIKRTLKQLLLFDRPYGLSRRRYADLFGLSLVHMKYLDHSHNHKELHMPTAQLVSLLQSSLSSSMIMTMAIRVNRKIIVVNVPNFRERIYSGKKRRLRLKSC